MVYLPSVFLYIIVGMIIGLIWWIGIANRTHLPQFLQTLNLV